MGNCASISSSSGVHDDDDDTYNGHGNVVYHGSQIIGSTYSHTGSKGLNQDSAVIFQGYGFEDGAFVGVFDGHGQNGHFVSKVVRNKLPSLLLSQRNGISKIMSDNTLLESDQNNSFQKWKEACISAFRVMDKEIKFLDKVDCSCSGATATVVVKQGEDLVVANLGDSRAVLGTRTEEGIIVAVQLTTDLKPGVPCEAERIRKCHGRVLALKEEPHIQRVWLPYDDSPGLAMSRAFGDFVLKRHGIICVPDVTYHRIAPNDDFLVLASDGVWDVVNNDQIMSIVSSAHSEEAAAKAVVDAAIASWEHKFPASKRDDCTAICLFLKKQLLRNSEK